MLSPTIGMGTVKIVFSFEISFKSTPLPELKADFADRNNQVSLSMATENVFLMHECSLDLLRMESIRLK